MESWKKGKRSQKVSYVCKGGDTDCGKVITGKERSVQCEACGDWYHPNCQGLCKGGFEALVKYDLLWICKECKARLTDTLNLGKRLERRVADAEKNIIEKVNQVRTQTTAEIEEKLQSSMKNMEEKVSKQVDENSDVLKKTVKVHELESKVDRSCNVVLYNVPESNSEDVEQRKEHDVKKVNDITRVLCGEDVQCKVEKVFRLGRRAAQVPEDTGEDKIIDRRPRLLLVKFEKKEDADMLFKNRFGLKDNGYTNTYINRDMSLEERLRQKKTQGRTRSEGKEHAQDIKKESRTKKLTQVSRTLLLQQNENKVEDGSRSRDTVPGSIAGGPSQRYGTQASLCRISLKHTVTNNDELCVSEVLKCTYTNIDGLNAGMRSRDIFGRLRLRLRLRGRISAPAPAPAPSKTVRRLRLRLRLREKCTGSGGSGSDDQVLI